MTDPRSADYAPTPPAIGDYSAAQIMGGHLGSPPGERHGGAALMPVLAVKDPASAQLILDAVGFLS